MNSTKNWNPFETSPPNPVIGIALWTLILIASGWLILRTYWMGRWGQPTWVWLAKIAFALGTFYCSELKACAWTLKLFYPTKPRGKMNKLARISGVAAITGLIIWFSWHIWLNATNSAIPFKA